MELVEEIVRVRSEWISQKEEEERKKNKK